MKKYQYLFLTIVSFLLLPTTINAMCTDEEKNHFNDISNTYTVTYEYDYNQKIYNITFNAPEPDKYGYIVEYKIGYDEIREEVYKHYQNSFEMQLQPHTYIIKVIGLTNTCNDTLKTTTLILNKKNSYAKDPLCNGIEEFALCQENYDKDIDYDTFVSRINIYKNTKSTATTSSSKKQDQQSKIASYIEENVFQIIIVVVFIVLLTITAIIMIKSFKKSRRLE